MQRLAVKPGLTGPWQVGGRSDVDFDDMVRLDLATSRAERDDGSEAHPADRRRGLHPGRGAAVRWAGPLEHPHGLPSTTGRSTSR